MRTITPAPCARAHPPMPVVVGAPRSGTTLLRMMLDAHPHLAIPPETGFLPALAALDGPAAVDPTALARTIASHPAGAPNWPDFHLAEEALQAAIAALPAPSPAEAARCFYRLYAARFGKPRSGDKTPVHAFALPTIARLLPEAAVLHIIRDGRDAALSLRPLWFAPGKDMPTLARHWRGFVTAARAGAQDCPRYMELRFEELVRDPEAVLRRVAAFLDLAYHPAMAEPQRRAAARLAEHQERRSDDGTLLVTRERRLEQQWRTATAPDPSRAGVWRTVFSVQDRAAFATEAGPLLDELGYGA